MYEYIQTHVDFKEANSNSPSKEYIMKVILKVWYVALAGVAQWIEHRLRTKGSLVWFPARARAWVSGQVPSGGACERQPHIDVSLSLFLPPFSSL